MPEQILGIFLFLKQPQPDLHFLLEQLLIKERVYSTTHLAKLKYSEIKSSHFSILYTRLTYNLILLRDFFFLNKSHEALGG